MDGNGGGSGGESPLLLSRVSGALQIVSCRGSNAREERKPARKKRIYFTFLRAAEKVRGRVRRSRTAEYLTGKRRGEEKRKKGRQRGVVLNTIREKKEHPQRWKRTPAGGGRRGERSFRPQGKGDSLHARGLRPSYRANGKNSPEKGFVTRTRSRSDFLLRTLIAHRRSKGGEKRLAGGGGKAAPF